MTHKIKDNTVAVSTSVYWLPIDEKTPLGVKLLLINRNAGVASLGQYQKDGHWTHWASLPKFQKD